MRLVCVVNGKQFEVVSNNFAELQYKALAAALRNRWPEMSDSDVSDWANYGMGTHLLTIEDWLEHIEAQGSNESYFDEEEVEDSDG